MAQFFNQIDVVAATYANNIGVDSLAGATTVLEDIPCTGVRNIAITIVCNTGAISAVALYGSPDGINYMAVSGFTTFAVSAGNVNQSVVVANFQFFRVQTTGIANIDIYFTAVQ